MIPPESFVPNGVITLTTDFGTLDGYVGAMKGVIYSRFAESSVLDITHDVPAQDVPSAARALSNACPYFPPGTVHVAVIDPGVGTNRAAVVALHDGQVYVAPDNGVLSQVVPPDAASWRVERSDLGLDKVSRTFHGRDIFAPVAAALASGAVAPSDVGAEHKLMRLPEPKLLRGDGYIRGEVVAIDSFGNLVTNIPLSELGSDIDLSRVRMEIGEIHIEGIAWSYSDAEIDEWVTVIGSRDTIEVSVRDGNAAKRSGARVGHSARLVTRGSTR